VTDKPTNEELKAAEPEDRNAVMKRKEETCQSCSELKDERCSLITCPRPPWFRSRCPVSKWIDPLDPVLQAGENHSA
jgi:hypothetical protein